MIASILKKQFGTRWCLMLSGTISSAGLIICALSNNIDVFLIGLLLIGKYMCQLSKEWNNILTNIRLRHVSIQTYVTCSGERWHKSPATSD